MAKNREENKDKRLDNLIPFKEGQSGNPNGRPKGQRNFETIYRSALEKLAKLNNTTPEALEDEMISKAIVESRKGQIQFYKDLMDRLYGRAVENVNQNINGTIEVKEIKYIVPNGHNTNTDK